MVRLARSRCQGDAVPRGAVSPRERGMALLRCASLGRQPWCATLAGMGLATSGSVPRRPSADACESCTLCTMSSNCAQGIVVSARWSVSCLRLLLPSLCYPFELGHDQGWSLHFNRVHFLVPDHANNYKVSDQVVIILCTPVHAQTCLTNLQSFCTALRSWWPVLSLSVVSGVQNKSRLVMVSSWRRGSCSC